jgi:TonB family protein
MARKARIALFLIVFSASAAAQDRGGKIVFYRESHFLTNDYKPRVLCDGAELARMAPGSYLEATAPPGRHVCVGESTDGPATTIDIIPGNVVYLLVDIVQGAVKRHAIIVTTTEAEYNRQNKLKPMAAVLLKAAPQAEASAQMSPRTLTDTEGPVHKARFGDLLVTATNLYTVPTTDVPDRSRVSVFLTFQNTGAGAVCPSFAARLKTTFGLEYLGSPGAPAGRDVPPDEIAERSYFFEVKSGVQPLELKLEMQGGTIRCASSSDSSSIDPSIPSVVRLDVHDLPGFGAAGPVFESTVPPIIGGVSYPHCVYCPDPKYTTEARDAHLEGTVHLQAIIGKDGTATDIKVVKGLGLGLDKQAVNAVQRWRFKPALGPNGDPVATIVPIEINFRLLK